MTIRVFQFEIKNKYIICCIHECRTLCSVFMYDYEVRALRVSLKCDFASVLEDCGASVFSVLISTAVVLVVVHAVMQAFESGCGLSAKVQIQILAT